MKRFVYLLAICALAACKPSADYVDGVIVFDNAIDYPEINLKLSDIVDIEYIPLKGMEQGYLIDSRGTVGNGIYIDEDEIYIKQSVFPPSEGIYVFDRSGNPLRLLRRSGRGPEEYGAFLMYSWIEPKTNSIYISGLQGIYEYDATTFDFRRNIWPKYDFSIPQIAPLNSEYVIVSNKYQGEGSVPDGFTTFHIVSLSDGEIKPLPITLQEPYVHDRNGYMEYCPIIQGQGGVFLSNERTDTIHWVDNQTMKLSPRMVDKTVYPRSSETDYSAGIVVVPSFETDKYLFFSSIFWPPYYPNMNRQAFVFDKRKEKIFRLPDTEEWKYLPAQNYGVPHGTEEYWLTAWNTTLNKDYGAVLLQAIHLIDNMDKLSPELKKVAETLDEGDNPVLAVMKFK
jgi:hypothetical protein